MTTPAVDIKVQLDASDVKAELDKLQKTMSDRIGAMSNRWTELRSAVELGAMAFRAVSGVVSTLTEGAIAHERATTSLGQALRMNSAHATTYLARLTAMNDATEEATGIDADAIANLQRKLLLLGVLPAELERATVATIGLVKIQGGDAGGLVEAATKVARVFQGQKNVLAEVGVTYRTAAEGIGKLAEGYKVAVAEGQSFAGGVARLKIAWDNFLEELGGAIIDNPAVRKAQEDLVSWVKDLTKEAENGRPVLQNYITAVVDGLRSVADFVRNNQGTLELALGLYAFGVPGTIGKALTPLAGRAALAGVTALGATGGALVLGGVAAGAVGFGLVSAVQDPRGLATPEDRQNAREAAARRAAIGFVGDDERAAVEAELARRRELGGLLVDSAKTMLAEVEQIRMAEEAARQAAARAARQWVAFLEGMGFRGKDAMVRYLDTWREEARRAREELQGLEMADATQALQEARNSVEATRELNELRDQLAADNQRRRDDIRGSIRAAGARPAERGADGELWLDPEAWADQERALADAMNRARADLLQSEQETANLWRDTWSLAFNSVQGLAEGFGAGLAGIFRALVEGSPLDADRLFGNLIMSMGMTLLQAGIMGVALGGLSTAIPALAPIFGGPAALIAGGAATVLGAGMVALGHAMGADTDPGAGGSNARTVTTRVGSVLPSTASVARSAAERTSLTGFRGAVGAPVTNIFNIQFPNGFVVGSRREVGKQLAGFLREAQQLGGI